MIFLAIAATAADAVTFMLMMALVGPNAESNWFVRMAGVPSAIAMKVSLMVFLTSFAYLIYEKATVRTTERRRIMWLVLAVAIVVGVLGSTANARVILAHATP